MFEPIPPAPGAPSSETCAVQPDPPDFRDRIYAPTLRPLSSEFNAAPYRDPQFAGTVTNQGSTLACTGFALASMVRQLTTSGIGPFSPYMLYYFARRYDEFGEDDRDLGSTARAAMMAWQKHGVCRYDLWPELGTAPSETDGRWAANAFSVPLGAYYRVDHSSISDLHAAVNETGAVYVTARIHGGWEAVRHLAPGASPTIPISHEHESWGGHAFLIVGYDREGFWIQNSWGAEWGLHGFARLSYGDWRANAMDAWVAQLGVNISRKATSLGMGLGAVPGAQEILASSALQAGGIAAPLHPLLSTNPYVRARQLDPYVIKLDEHGRVSNRGKFATTYSGMRSLLSHYLPHAVDAWDLGPGDPIDIAIFVHSGLGDEEKVARSAERWIPGLFSARIFPVFVAWETDLLGTLRNLTEQALKPQPGAAGAGFWARNASWKEDRFERFMATTGARSWKAAIHSQYEAAWRLHDLFENWPSYPLERLRFHLIGHGAGTIFLERLLDQWRWRWRNETDNGIRIDSIYYMASASTVGEFRERMLEFFRTGRIRAFTNFGLADEFERSDSSHTLPYDKSLLYLISNAFEQRRGTPLLGMERNIDPWLQERPNADTEVWDWIIGPNSRSEDERFRCGAKSHADFDDDLLTFKAILARLEDRRNRSHEWR